MNKRYTQSCAVHSEDELLQQLKNNRDARKKVKKGTLRERVEARGVKLSEVKHD